MVHWMKVLILEDDDERATAFIQEISDINSQVEVMIWQSAHKMCQDLAVHLPSTVLISLDHDLRTTDEHNEDPGSGMDVAKALSLLSPSCPVIVHTSNADASWSMINELTHSGWSVERAGPVGMGTEWVRTVWAPVARRMMAISKG
jgi:hypothetical protein